MNIRNFIISSLFLVPQILSADHLSSEFTALSDYIYRGVTRTDHGPAIQGDMHYSYDFGLGFGTSISNVGADEARGMEAQTDIAYFHTFHKYFQATAKVEFFNNPFAPHAQTLDLGIGFLFTKYFQWNAFYSPKYLGTGTSAKYVQLATEFDILPSQNLSLDLSTGYTKFGKEAQAGSTSYYDYKIALHRTHENHDIGLFWVGTNRRIIDNRGFDRPAKDEVFGAAYTVQFY